MGKTIALKLTKQEAQIVDHFNKKGISNSEILRDAFWHYLKTINFPIKQQHQPKKDTPQRQTTQSSNQHQQLIQTPEDDQQTLNTPLTQDYIQHLKNEIAQLRDQNIQFQLQLDREITRLHGQIYQLYSNIEPQKQNNTATNEDTHTDIHQDIDSFLYKKSKK